MVKGKKKGKKEGEGDPPSLSTLSLSDAPSTSTQADDDKEESGLSRKAKRKQKQMEAKGQPKVSDETPKEEATPKPAEEPPLEAAAAKPAEEKKPEAEVKKETKKDEPKEEEADGLGLGLGGGGKKRPRKKKSLAAAEAAAKVIQGSEAPLQSVPEQTARPPGLAQAPQASPWQSGPPQVGPIAPKPVQQPALQPTTSSVSSQPPTSSVPSQPPTSSVPSQPPTASKELVRMAPSRLELSCRYKIPNKVLGRTVRHLPLKVITNYLPMTFKPINVYRYDVIIKPDKPKKMLCDVFKQALKNSHPENLYIAFDQAKNCYTLEPLKGVPADGSSRFNCEDVILKDPNGKAIKFEVSFKATGLVNLAKLKQYMDTGGSTLNAPMEEIQCVDVILRQGALEAYVKCGRQFFKRPNNPIDLTGGLEIWTGLFQSAIFTTHAFINIDVAHKGFPVHQSMIDAITKSFRLDTDRKIEDQRSREVENFLSFLKGLRVIATLLGPSKGQTREYICNGLVDIPSRVTFPYERDGVKKTMTVAEYYKKDKGYTIKYGNLNCMWVGPREKCIYYPIELLYVAYGQARNRQLNEYQLSNMVRQAATPPYERKRKIEEVASAMNYSKNIFFKKFGLEISDKFLEVDAKILAPPKLNVGEKFPAQPRKGQWNSNHLFKPEALASWGFIAIDCNSDACNYEYIRELLMNTGRQLGMDVAEPKMKSFNVRITELKALLHAAVDKQVRFVFIIVGTRGRDTYHKVKQLAEKEVGILTQCIKENTASRRMNGQTIKNILLKVNSKLMGVNQILDVGAVPNCLKGGDVMIVGADVTHPSPDQSNVPSIAAVSASMDGKGFSYSIELSIQTPKKEMILEFEDMMVDHLIQWRDKHRALPRKIFVFRDGVSEGQFAEVMNSELAAVHKAYARLRGGKPEVLFLLVQKRHHTRFFTAPKCENVEPGTVVDTHIVHAKELDFYLVSHQAIKGTARPTRYHAVCNDGNIPHDEVEQLTFYLCHLYSRCMRSVSYPTPTYYAHLACFRARSLTYGHTFDNAALEVKPQRLRVLDKMLQFSRMFFV